MIYMISRRQSPHLGCHKTKAILCRLYEPGLVKFLKSQFRIELTVCVILNANLIYSHHNTNLKSVLQRKCVGGGRWGAKKALPPAFGGSPELMLALTFENFWQWAKSGRRRCQQTQQPGVQISRQARLLLRLRHRPVVVCFTYHISLLQRWLSHTLSVSHVRYESCLLCMSHVSYMIYETHASCVVCSHTTSPYCKGAWHTHTHTLSLSRHVYVLVFLCVCVHNLPPYLTPSVLGWLLPLPPLASLSLTLSVCLSLSPSPAVLLADRGHLIFLCFLGGHG